MEVRIIGCTYNEDEKEYNFDIPREAEIFAGRNAGICYMEDDYFTDKASNIESCLKRAARNAKSGHYSVYGHYHITFLLEGVPKIVAMVLNNITTYNTSEKSARYTRMKPETQLEEDLYNKWQTKFEDIIKSYGEDNYHKLAQENARYMISVFTPTTMSYTIPYNRLLLLFKWIDQFEKDVCNPNIEIISGDYVGNFYKKLSYDLKELKTKLKEVCKIGEDNIELEEHKGMYIDLFYNVRPNMNNNLYEASIKKITPYYGDCYTSTYRASLAAVAQIQRHRTTKIKIQLGFYNQGIYIPEIIRNTLLEHEWIIDFGKIKAEGIIPQGLLVDVVEYGTFENFVLKCKERLCSRAQYEVMKITSDQLNNFLENRENLDKFNDYTISSMHNLDFSNNPGDNKVVKNVPAPRCYFNGYKCKEPCKYGKNGLCRKF